MKRSSFLERKQLNVIENFVRIEPQSSGIIQQVTSDPIRVQNVVNDVENKIDVRGTTSNAIHDPQSEVKLSKTSSTFDMGSLTSFLSGITPSLSKPVENKQVKDTSSTSSSEVQSSLNVQAQPTRAWRKTIESEDKRGKTVLPLANGRFSLDTLSIYTSTNKTNLRPEKSSKNKANSNLIRVNVL